MLTAFTGFPLCFWHLAVLNSLSSVDLRTFPKNLQFVTAVTSVTDIDTHFVPVGDALCFSVGAGTKHGLKDHYVEKCMCAVCPADTLFMVRSDLFIFVYLCLYFLTLLFCSCIPRLLMSA